MKKKSRFTVREGSLKGGLSHIHMPMTFRFGRIRKELVDQQFSFRYTITQIWAMSRTDVADLLEVMATMVEEKW